jgi:hypothetical protein
MSLMMQQIKPWQDTHHCFKIFKYLGPHSQNFIFFTSYEWGQYAAVLIANYILCPSVI